MKKITIIIPCYNCEKTLNRCLDSVFQQTYKNLEIIAVNDGSKDGTLDILKSYAEKYNNLVIIDKPNGGVSSARNDAIKVATGDYIEFLDSDDNFLFDNVLEKNVKLLEEKGVDVVVFSFTHPCFQPHLPSGIYDLHDKLQFKKYYQDFFFCSMPWNKLFKKEVITDLYDESMAFAEDELFNLANIKNINKIYINNEVLLNYYCEPVVSKENASAINKIYVRDNFWEKKDTIWYKCIDNNAKRDVVFKKYFTDSESNDMKYVRPFDFFFYDFAFMCHLNTDLDILKKQCVDGIARESEFLNVLKSKEKYGLKLKSDKMEDLTRYMSQFVECGNKAFHLNRNNQMGLRLYLALFGLFGLCFYDINGELNTEDILAETMQNVLDNSTKEAGFVNELATEYNLTRGIQGEMTNKEHIEKSLEYEKQGHFNEDINPVDWNDCYPVTSKFPYVEKNIFKRFSNYLKRVFVVNPFMRKQNKKVFKTKVVGRENIKGIKSAIVTSNHYNIFDCLAVRYALKDNKLKYCVAEYNNRKGHLGSMMRATGIMPLSSKYNVQKEFCKAMDYYMHKGRKVVFYPEQAMWYMYEKPRPFKDGAFYYAVRNNVPIIPLFTTFKGTGVRDKEGIEIKELVVNIMPPIYPNPELKSKENIEFMKTKNYEMCKEKYEEFYHKKLEYLK